LPTKAVAIAAPNLSIDKLEEALRCYKIPIIVRISKDRLVLDVRTIFEEEIDIISEALEWAIGRQCIAAAQESGVMH
jgi:L-seryl-tRNA(Ser) seleniumtransferase